MNIELTKEEVVALAQLIRQTTGTIGVPPIRSSFDKLCEAMKEQPEEDKPT